MEPLGKEHDDHEEEEEHERGHAHHNSEHLELSDHPITAQALVPDIILHITPIRVKRGRARDKVGRERYGRIVTISLSYRSLDKGHECCGHSQTG